MKTSCHEMPRRRRASLRSFAADRPSTARSGTFHAFLVRLREAALALARSRRGRSICGHTAGVLILFAHHCSANDDALLARAKEEFGVVQAADPVRINAPVSVLGRALFWDGRISADGKTSCASCHHAEDWGADRRAFSPDARGKLTSRHSQTVFNSMLQPALRWTGDRNSGAHQAEKSLTGSMGFAASAEVVPLLRQHGYAAAFQKAFPAEADPLTPTNYATALQAYQATLTTPAPFDRFLAGDAAALSPDARTGLKVFLDTGCADCHSGPLLGGRGLKKFGVKKPWWEATGSTGRDGGVFETTKKEEDRDRFRVTMLRNIAKTAPYFHDGSVASLTEAVQVMADVQHGQRLSEAEARAITAFLQSLTGEVPAHYAPSAPAAGPSSPAAPPAPARPAPGEGKPVQPPAAQ